MGLYWTGGTINSNTVAGSQLGPARRGHIHPDENDGAVDLGSTLTLLEHRDHPPGGTLNIYEGRST